MLELVCLILKMICGMVLWVSMELKKEILLVRTIYNFVSVTNY